MLGQNLSRSVLQCMGFDVTKCKNVFFGVGLNSRGTYQLIYDINILHAPKLWDSGF